MRWFIRHYSVDMAEAAKPEPSVYPAFNDFFTRALRPGVRPLAGGDNTVVAPVDGRISQAGAINAGTLFQAKGFHYTAAALLGDSDRARLFGQGAFATLYLAPGDYHRVHMPLAGCLRRMIHVPGRLYSVAPWAVATLPSLFTRNERVCAVFDTDHGAMAVVLVGAMNVGAIETTWAGLVTPPRGRSLTVMDYPEDAAPALERGAEMGRFNLGSTVIILLARNAVWEAGIRPGDRIRLGQPMTTLPQAAEVRPGAR